MKISILIPCHNEGKSIRRCIESCLNQTRKADQIVVVNDCSTDDSLKILQEFGESILVVTPPKRLGNKSYAQEYGLKFIEGEIFVTTDGDTIFDEKFIEEIEKDFQDENVAAVGGYVKSIKKNWLTACRELDYVIGQDLHKLAQSELDFLFVIPGAAGAFRKKVFSEHISFDHDTLTEDLDFTYRLHLKNLRIKYNQQAIVHTQDPADLDSYVRQMRRWYSGGWQNLVKHHKIIGRPLNALELSLIYLEGFVFSLLVLTAPFINLKFSAFIVGGYLVYHILIGIYASLSRKRLDLLLYSPLAIILSFINAYVFIEQFVEEVILKKKKLSWVFAKRWEIN